MKRLGGLLVAEAEPLVQAETLPCQTRDVTVQGTSMVPRIADGETITVVSGGAACAEPLARGDVLVLWTDSHPLPLIKALRGLPGDTLAVRGGAIYVNDTVCCATPKAPPIGCPPAGRQ